jgi:hypothetical protein
MKPLINSLRVATFAGVLIAAQSAAVQAQGFLVTDSLEELQYAGLGPRHISDDERARRIVNRKPISEIGSGVHAQTVALAPRHISDDARARRIVNRKPVSAIGDDQLRLSTSGQVDYGPRHISDDERARRLPNR